MKAGLFGMQRSRPIPPAVVDLPGEFVHRMLHTRGVRLHAAVAGDPSDPLILLIHGAYGGWFDYRHVIAPLAQLGYHVAALDQRGFGMSDKPAHRSGNLLHILRGDLKGAIATLGHTEATIVAADTGAVIAGALTSAAPALVTRLLTLPFEPALPRLLRATPPALLWRVPGAQARLDAAWQHPFTQHSDGSTLEDVSASVREALELRLRARRIDNALPHIMATHRLRPRNAHAGAKPPARQLDVGALAHVITPERVLASVEKHLP